jgi:hypothetical protein
MSPAVVWLGAVTIAEKHVFTRSTMEPPIQAPRSISLIAKIQISYCIAFVCGCALTQSVGWSLGALVFIVVSTMWPSWAMLKGLGWSRLGYIIAGVFTPWMALNAANTAEFFQDALYYAALVSFLLYFVTCVILFLPTVRKFFSVHQGTEFGSLGKGLSLWALAACSFIFASGWTDASTALYLLNTGDYHGVGVSLLFVIVGMGLVILISRLWWRDYMPHLLALVWLSTGWVLLEHAFCYGAITALVYAGNDPYMHVAASHARLIIIGRFVFALAAITIGSGLRGRSPAIERVH